MKFSVLMSVYKDEKAEYFRESLRSVLIDQNLKPDEIVIVEDGPIGSTLEDVIKEYKNKFHNVISVKLPLNQGLGIALNEGLKVCKYNIVARMDSDDIAHPDRFKEQIKVFQLNKNIDVVGSNIAEFDNSLTKIQSYKNVPQANMDIVTAMRRRCPLNHMSVVYKKDVVLSSGGYEHCMYFEDYYLWCRLAMQGAVFYNIQSVLIDMRAGSAISLRRGGVVYAKAVINFQKKLQKIGFISRTRLFINILIRIPIALMPGYLRILFYKSFLRSRLNEV